MGEEGFVVRLRGLPWSATPEDVEKFFDGCEINEGVNGVHLTYSREGRPSGEAFVEFVSEDDVQAALKKNKEHLGQRYIEVFRSKKGEMEWVIKRAGLDSPNMSEAVVKLRGLPFGCSKEEIAQFFTETKRRQVLVTTSKFVVQRLYELSQWYIEIFKSSMSEANAVFGNQRGGFRPPMGPGMGIGRPSPYDRNDRFGGPIGPGMGMGGPMGMGFNRGRGGRNLKGYYDDEFDDYNMGFGGMGYMGQRGRGGMRPPRGRMMIDERPRMGHPGSHYISKTGHSVHMRGMPFLAIEQDVFDFFAPIQPVRVEFEYGSDGRRTGEANVDFATHQEALEAMKKHRSNMRDGAGGGYGNQGGFNGGQFSSNSSGSGGGYGMGGSMGSGGGYGGGKYLYRTIWMNNSYMDGGGYGGNLTSNTMGSMANPNYTAF
ncbi:hypothetical protein C0Q70_01493 [Pomacea canaliculata]|uniref:RRM domain-containing protein n=1 Tax=Pomacea canaliculata TaxID=400727 RepID=A0A2T7PZM5_POMCA|nr:hypothetical protein C0Q70_01493 [Pomacea canaliculata]